MTIAAGKLNRRITLQQRSAGQDAAGQPVDTWIDVAKPWANVAGDTGLGTIRNDVPLAVKRYSFRIRYRTGIDESMRVLFGGMPFDIKTVRMDFAGKQWTDLVCEQGGSDG